MSRAPVLSPTDYCAWLASLKRRIQGARARARAALAVSAGQIRLYAKSARTFSRVRLGMTVARGSLTDCQTTCVSSFRI